MGYPATRPAMAEVRTRRTMQERHLSVGRTARYITFGNSADPKQVWFVCHGYRQLASRFARYFGVLDDGQTYVVAPEALSRFYPEGDPGPHGPGAKVGATWMTREDRLNEIEDYVGYLDSLYDCIFETIERSAVRVRVLGFSQGAETAGRWIDRGRVRADHLILWGGHFPKDVDLERRDTPLRRLTQREARLKESGIPYDLVRFDGGHHLNKYVLSDLARVPV
jgi:predicted esterase